MGRTIVVTSNKKQESMSSLSIIIVSYRCWNRLAACLQSLAAQDMYGLEVIVVDNHSDDGRAQDFVIQHPQVRFILQDINGGFAQACNKGATVATGKWLLFLNPDTILQPNTLLPLLERANSEPEWKLIGIKQINEKGKDTRPHGIFLEWWNVWPPIKSLQALIMGPSKSRNKWSNDPIGFPDWISGSFVLIRARDFDELGGWDERFWMYCEDMDLSKRAAGKGWKRVMYNEINCIHSHGGSSRINPSVKALTKSHVIISTFKYLQKHIAFPLRWIAYATLFLMTSIDLILSFFFSETKRKMVGVLLGKEARRQ